MDNIEERVRKEYTPGIKFRKPGSWSMYTSKIYTVSIPQRVKSTAYGWVVDTIEEGWVHAYSGEWSPILNIDNYLIFN